MTTATDRRLLIAVTGASGCIYAERLIRQCAQIYPRIYLVISEAGRKVIAHELSGSDAQDLLSLNRMSKGEVSKKYSETIRLFDNTDLFAPIASGSSAPTEMVVVPCSMGSLARIAHGMSTCLIERAADVVLKQKRKLIIVPRETPFNTIHLSNMLRLSEIGVDILPAMPAFYQKPQSISDAVDFVVGKIMEQLNLDHELYRPWNSRMR